MFWRQGRVLCLSLILLISAPITAYDQEKTFPLVINPCSGHYSAFMKNWRLPFNGKTIREWSFSQGLNLVDDREPVVDDTAAYVGPHGSTVTINGLSRNGRYRLWIDFVRFTTGEKRRDSLLKIFVSAPSVESSCISAVRATDIGEAYFYVDIPRTISVRGSVELSFVEYGASSGNWGVWDIIVSTVGELPRRDDIPRDETINLKVDDRIVQ